MIRLDFINDQGQEVYTFLDEDGLSVGSFKLDCGFGHPEIRSSTEARIWSFEINSYFRKRGYGSQMIAEAVARASELGFSSIWLYVKQNNDAAIKCYKKAGFEVAGVSQYSPDSYDMVLILPYQQRKV